MDPRWPTGETLDVVAMFPEESFHYPIWNEDGDNRWTMSLPHGGGFVQIQSGEVYDVAMFHQLRCLWDIRSSLEAANSTVGYLFEEDENVNSCFEYLRRSIFCHSDNTLEGAIGSHFLLDISSPHVCRDWTRLYELVEDTSGELSNY